MNVKDGWRTTEFWMVAIPMLAGIILIFMGNAEDGWKMFGGAGAGSVYALARSNEKKGATESTAKVEVARSEMLGETSKADAAASKAEAEVTKLAILNEKGG